MNGDAAHCAPCEGNIAQVLPSRRENQTTFDINCNPNDAQQPSGLAAPYPETPSFPARFHLHAYTSRCGSGSLIESLALPTLDPGTIAAVVSPGSM